MPTELELIKAEQLASIIFIISSLQALGSANEAEQALIEKQNGKITDPEATISSTKLAAESTVAGFLGFMLFTIVAIIRKNKLVQSNEAGTTNTPIAANIAIVVGFLISSLGYVIRLPGILEKLKEASPVVL